jgi:retinol dehydrogenase-14
LLKAAAPARIVTVSSSGESMGRINFDDLQGEQRYSGMRAYSQSKLANVLFTYELARRLDGSGVTANCLHPGVVRTEFARYATGGFKLLTRALQPFLLSVEKGAETSVHLASSAEVEGVTGRYFAKKRMKRSSERSHDVATARRLWDISEAMTRAKD